MSRISEIAIAKILSGHTAHDCETSTLDFKEDTGNRTGLESAIVKAAIGFANASGGEVVVGVADRVPGAAAFTGTAYPADNLRQRIYELTRPPLLVDIETREIPKRHLVIEVRAGAAVFADTAGRSWQRINADCMPLQPADLARLSQERSGFDWSAEPSGSGPDAIARDALDAARDLLRRLPDERNQIAKLSDADLLRSLGLLAPDGSLTRGGKVLLCPGAPDQHLLVYQYKPTPGGEPRAVLRLSAPMLGAYLKLMDHVAARQSTVPVAMPNGQQLAIEDFPTVAVREALSNALCHRDWQVAGPVSVDHSPEVFSVTSPGPLVAGVTPQNILTVPSRPRNRSLSAATRHLGLAEETGRGVDRMYREAIRSGRKPPQIEAFADRVKVSFVGGAPDTNIARFIARLSADERDDTDTMLLLDHLCRAQTVTAQQARPILQKPDTETALVLLRLSSEPVMLLEPTRQSMGRSKPVYRLREEALRGLGAAVSYNRRTMDETDRKIVEHIREYGKVTNRTLQNMFDVHVFRARDILSSLQARQIITKMSASSRGSKVEWGEGPKFPKVRSKRGKALQAATDSADPESRDEQGMLFRTK